MDEILKALPVPTAMLAAAVAGLWKRLVDREKEHAAALAAKDAEIKEWSKLAFSATQKFEIASEKLRRVSGHSSNPPST